MSGGPKSREELLTELGISDVDQRKEASEVASAVERIISNTRRRAEVARKRQKRDPLNETLVKNYLLAAQEFYAITRLLQLTTTLGSKVMVLQKLVDTYEERDDLVDGLMGRTASKKNDTN